MDENIPNNDLQECLARAQGTLYAVIFTFLGGSADAMDVLQETNLAILQELRSGIDGSESELIQYFKKVAMSTAREFRRSKRRERLLLDDNLAEKLADIVAASDKIDEPDSKIHLRKCVHKLPPWQQEVLKERYCNAIPVREMAKRRAVSRVSLSVLMFRMRNAIKSCIERLRKRDALGVLPETPEEEFVADLEEIFDGTAGKAVIDRVANALRSSDSILAFYAEHAMLHAMLAFEGKNAVHAESRERFRFSAVAAVILLFTGAALAYFAISKETPPQEHYDEEVFLQKDTTGDEEMTTKKSLLLAATVAATTAIAAENNGVSTASSGTLAFNDVTVNTLPVAEKSVDSRTVSSASSTSSTYNTDKPQGTVVILY